MPDEIGLLVPTARRLQTPRVRLIAVAFVLFACAAIAAAVSAQEAPDFTAEPDAYDAEAWMRTTFADRERQFEQEAREAEWAKVMEAAIEEKVAEFDRPLEEVIGASACVLVSMCRMEMPTVELVSAECRSTLCKMEMHWPAGTFRGVVGQQLSFLYGLGIDHQGELYSDDDGSRYLVKLYARRR